MEWFGMLLSMADHTLCPRPCPAEEGFFLIFLPSGSDRIPFLLSLAQTPLEVFNVLGLGPWPNIYINMGSLAFHPYINHSKIFSLKHLYLNSIAIKIHKKYTCVEEKKRVKKKKKKKKRKKHMDEKKYKDKRKIK